MDLNDMNANIQLHWFYYVLKLVGVESRLMSLKIIIHYPLIDDISPEPNKKKTD